MAEKMADELKRRLVHASGSGLVALYLLATYLDAALTWNRFQALTVFLTVCVFVLEFVRLRIGLEWWIFEKLTREYEQDQVAGYALYMVGMAAVVLLFDPEFALPAMLMLALADPISGELSREGLRRVKRPRALVGMFVLCTLLALPFLSDHPEAALAAALGATIADGVTVKYGDFVLDDNLTIPIYAATLAYVTVEVTPF